MNSEKEQARLPNKKEKGAYEKLHRGLLGILRDCASDNEIRPALVLFKMLEITTDLALHLSEGDKADTYKLVLSIMEECLREYPEA